MAASTTPRKRERSPNYPGLSLETALERAKTLLKEEGRNAAPVSAIVKHWGYNPKSSSGLIALAALRYFGLLDHEGTGEDRHGRLSKLALSILLDERPNSLERAEAIKTAALEPKLYGDLWREYAGHLPSDDTLRFQLRSKRGFTDTAATDFIRKFRATLTFAGLTESGSVSANDAPHDEDDDEQDPPPNGLLDAMLGADLKTPDPKPETAPLSFKMTLPGGGEAVMATTRPLTEAEWARLQTVLDAMKPTFVPDSE
jgi:hypothetical protein